LNFKLKKPVFKSKKAAYGTFFSYLMAPYGLVGLGIIAVIKARNFGLISYDHAKQSIYFVIVVSLVALIYCWHRAFWAIAAIMKDDYGKAPETVICVNCREPFLFEQVKMLKCPKCNGKIVDLEGFCERHPEFVETHKKKRFKFNMIGDDFFQVTEWDWLKLQLDVVALKSRGNYVSKLYHFNDDKRTITCSVYLSDLQEERTRQVSRQEDLETYMDWLRSEQMIISKLMERLPKMQSSFDFKKQFVLEILQERPGGMSPHMICRIEGDEVIWGPGY